jgi:hypothetical protein
MRHEGILAGLAIASVILGACGNSTTGAEFRAALSEAGQLVAPQDAPSPGALGRASFAAVPGPLVFVMLRGGEAAAPMVPFGENRGFVTWSTADKQTLTLRNGIMTATRGLGDDLMSTDATGLAAAVAAGSGRNASLVTRHLDGNDGIVARRFACNVGTDGREAVTLVSGQTISASRVVADCADGALNIRNVFWKDEGGTVRRSRQWVSPDVGYVEIEVLRL